MGEGKKINGESRESAGARKKERNAAAHPERNGRETLEDDDREKAGDCENNKACAILIAFFGRLFVRSPRSPEIY